MVKPKPARAKKSTQLGSIRYSPDSLNTDKEFTAPDVLKLLVKHLNEEHNFSPEQIHKLLGLHKDEIMIPVSIFNERLGSMETVTKYLIDVIGLKNRDAARLLNRNVRTIWTSYRNALRKMPQKLVLAKDCRFYIPASEFKNRSFSSLEVIVKHLKEHYELTFHEIALLLKRDDSTVWTVYSRAKKKEKANKKNEKKAEIK